MPTERIRAVKRRARVASPLPLMERMQKARCDRMLRSENCSNRGRHTRVWEEAVEFGTQSAECGVAGRRD